MKYPIDKIEKVLNHNCFKKRGSYDGTLKEMMADCLKTLWEEGEGFSGKRPVCDSCWEDIAAEALAILEPKIGKFKKSEYVDEEDYFEVEDNDLYLKTFNWLVDFIFANATNSG